MIGLTLLRACFQRCVGRCETQAKQKLLSLELSAELTVGLTGFLRYHRIGYVVSQSGLYANKSGTAEAMLSSLANSAGAKAFFISPANYHKKRKVPYYETRIFHPRLSRFFLV